ncbi:MAG: aromatic ring-hydroxylating dioxygenase subunit alpha [Actinomycetota bacterium]
MALLDDHEVVERIHEFIDTGETFVGEMSWREPVANYLERDRFDRELALMRRSPVVVCPSAALDEPGSYLARDVAGVPVLAIRGDDGAVRVLRNACRHRGVQVAEGTGCRHTFVCRYHGWSYGKDGELRHVPHEHGFPGLDKEERGLVPVSSVEAGGLVFATLDGDAPAAPDLPIAELVPGDHRVVDFQDVVLEANWKIFMESFLEGYHIRSTHANTFYPIQYDNLNWIEFAGSSTRIAFPYRSIERLRDEPLRPGAIGYYLTYVYHLFPNVIVATTPGVVNTIVLEPLSPSTTRMASWFTRVPGPKPLTSKKDGKVKGPDYKAALAEDQAMVTSGQRGLATGANEFLEFGLFESAIVRFHERLASALEEQPVELSGAP